MSTPSNIFQDAGRITILRFHTSDASRLTARETIADLVTNPLCWMTAYDITRCREFKGDTGAARRLLSNLENICTKRFRSEAGK